MSVARNDPCPCGSGEKYKKCCMISGGPAQRLRSRILQALTALVVVAALAVFFILGVGTAIFVALVGIMVVGGYALFSDPPSSGTGGTNPGAINFGS